MVRKVLSGLIKRINKDVKSTSINSIEDIESNLMELKNKKILITGATGGIRNSLLERFNSWCKNSGNQYEWRKIRQNYKIFLKYNRQKIWFIEHSKIQEFIEKIFSELNGIDVLINNAG